MNSQRKVSDLKPGDLFSYIPSNKNNKDIPQPRLYVFLASENTKTKLTFTYVSFCINTLKILRDSHYFCGSYLINFHGSPE